MDLVINLKNLSVESRDKIVFYASHQFIVYKLGQYIRFENCEGDLISEVLCADNDRAFSVVDFNDCIVLLVGGSELFVFDKSGFECVTHHLNPSVDGRVITDIFPAGDFIVAGVNLNGRNQFIIYDFINGKTHRKSQCWTTSRIDSMVVDNQTAYASLDGTFVIALDLVTGEVLWSRFETGIVKHRLVPTLYGLAYVAGDALKITKDGIADTFLIPGLSPEFLLGGYDSKLYCAADDGTSVVAVDLNDKKILWDVVGSNTIYESLQVKGKINNQIVNAMLVRFDTYIASIDLDNGRKMGIYPISEAYRMTKTSDHVLVCKRGSETDLIPGVIV